MQKLFCVADLLCTFLAGNYSLTQEANNYFDSTTTFGRFVLSHVGRSHFPEIPASDIHTILDNMEEYKMGLNRPILPEKPLTEAELPVVFMKSVFLASKSELMQKDYMVIRKDFFV